MKYKVHVYAVVRVPLDIEAESQEVAIKLASDIDFVPAVRNTDAEYAEEIVGYLVDEEGDEEHANSRSYDANGKLEQPQGVIGVMKVTTKHPLPWSLTADDDCFSVRDANNVEIFPVEYENHGPGQGTTRDALNFLLDRQPTVAPDAPIFEAVEEMHRSREKLRVGFKINNDMMVAKASADLCRAQVDLLVATPTTGAGLRAMLGGIASMFAEREFDGVRDTLARLAELPLLRGEG